MDSLPLRKVTKEWAEKSTLESPVQVLGLVVVKRALVVKAKLLPDQLTSKSKLGHNFKARLHLSHPSQKDYCQDIKFQQMLVRMGDPSGGSVS